MVKMFGGFDEPKENAGAVAVAGGVDVKGELIPVKENWLFAGALLAA